MHIINCTFNLQLISITKYQLPSVLCIWFYSSKQDRLFTLDLPSDEVMGGNNLRSCLNNFPRTPWWDEFKRMSRTLELSKTSSIIAIDRSSTTLSSTEHWSRKMVKYVATVSCLSNTDKTFHVEGLFRSFASPSRATWQHKKQRMTRQPYWRFIWWPCANLIPRSHCDRNNLIC